MSRYARKRDANHAPIAKRFQQLGCTVCDTSATGIPGFPDLFVGFRGTWHGIEIKNPESRYGKAGLNANQSAFDRDSNGERLWVVTSEDEATAIVRNWAREA